MIRQIKIHTYKISDPSSSPLQVILCETRNHQKDVMVLWSIALAFSILHTDIDTNYIVSTFVDTGQISGGEGKSVLWQNTY